MIYSRGKNPNSKKKRVHYINDNYFETPNFENCYWAGLLAADGNISKKVVTISLQERDCDQIEKLNKALSSNYSVKHYFAKSIFPYCCLAFSSEKITKDLYKNFSITPKKSLTLIPPNIKTSVLIDSFICGYIDGDGCIGLYNTKRQKALSISLLGTYELCVWIKNRFEEILGKQIKGLRKKVEHKNNTYSLAISDLNARKIFKHYYDLDLPKLNRKWSKEIYTHCNTYAKFRNIEKYKLIQNKMKELNSQTLVAKDLSISQAAVSWYTKQDIYKQLDKGGEVIE